MSRWIVVILFGVAVAFTGCGPQGAEPNGEKGDSGPAVLVPFRVVTGNPSVSCADKEILVSVVCAKGAPDGSKCPSDAVGLCAPRFMADIQQLYKDLLGREVDAPGLAYWSGVAARSGSLDPVRVGIMSGEEYRSKQFTAGVQRLYKDLLGREADAPGLAYWSGVAARSNSLDPVRAGIMSGEEYRSKHK